MARGAVRAAPTIRHPLIEKLKLYVDLREAEIEPLARLLARERSVPRGREIVIALFTYSTMVSRSATRSCPTASDRS